RRSGYGRGGGRGRRAGCWGARCSLRRWAWHSSCAEPRRHSRSGTRHFSTPRPSCSTGCARTRHCRRAHRPTHARYGQPARALAADVAEARRLSPPTRREARAGLLRLLLRAARAEIGAGFVERGIGCLQAAVERALHDPTLAADGSTGAAPAPPPP
ncbi:hypothetical protein T492DRAFT_904623, partial [Pavlovales sp. CCMP2436]